MSENLCNLIPYGGGVLHSEDIANNVTITEEGHVLDARQGKALNDRISQEAQSLSSTIDSFSSIRWVASNKAIYRYGFACDRATTTTLKIDPEYAYNNIVCLVFTRGSIVTMFIGTSEKGKATSVTQTSLIGTAPFTASVTNGIVTLTMPTWETFEMLFSSHANHCPAFSVVNN